MFFLIGRQLASTRLGCISRALALPVSRGRHGKLVDNFSHESDVTSLQDPFTSRPQKTPSYFIVVFHVKCEEASSFNQCMLCVFLSRPFSVLPCSSRHAYWAQAFPRVTVSRWITRSQSWRALLGGNWAVWCLTYPSVGTIILGAMFLDI